uniref:Uncharacterized protein n=1 Tax=Zea mays TaxID=4577 RepID=A0A804NNP9_MAIZE
MMEVSHTLNCVAPSPIDHGRWLNGNGNLPNHTADTTQQRRQSVGVTAWMSTTACPVRSADSWELGFYGSRSPHGCVAGG